jgi:hypothetical protein
VNVVEWKSFRLDEVFSLRGGFYNKKPEHSREGAIPFLAATDRNNGVTDFYSLDDLRQWDKVGNIDDSLEGKIFPGPAIAVTVNGACGSAFYQDRDYTCSHDITSLRPLDGHSLSIFEGLFVCAVIEQEKYRWSYGRKPHDISKLAALQIKLPVTDCGSPHWELMNEFINTLQIPDIGTDIAAGAFNPKLENWSEFKLNELYDVRMGNKFDLNKMTKFNPTVNFVSRISFNNGVSGLVDLLDGVTPFPAGLITVALGGSYLGSAFVQAAPFYTAQNVAVLTPKFAEMSFLVNLFVTVVIRHEARAKFCAFGRELNVHIGRNFSIKLPVDDLGCPDWSAILRFMRTLPLSDRLC